MTTEEVTTAVVTSFFQALRAGDLDAAFQCFHPDSEIDEPEGLPYGGRYRGPEGVMRLVTAISQDYDFEIGETDIRPIGPDEALGILEATFISKSTGKRVHTKVVELYRFTDGLISFADIFPKDTRALYELTR
jgi:ketosteroid isomerase-like protein